MTDTVVFIIVILSPCTISRSKYELRYSVFVEHVRLHICEI